MNETILSAINQEKAEQGITRIEVEGFKSLYERSSIEIRPLTILAGANSSGKSSIMQPLLMMKQTLEAPSDPGALLLDGPNVKFTSVDQFLSKRSGQNFRDSFTVKIGIDCRLFLENSFYKSEQFIDIIYSMFVLDEIEFKIDKNMNDSQIISLIDKYNISFKKSGVKEDQLQYQLDILDAFEQFIIKRNRIFLNYQGILTKPILDYTDPKYNTADFIHQLYYWDSWIDFAISVNHRIHHIFSQEIRQVIHVPGVRGNPERTYKRTAINSGFPGNFENYVASIIQNWQDTQDERLIQLCQNLENIGLTGKVATKIINGVQMEIQVGNLPRNSESVDMVNIADVGFGGSQTLPVLVALLVAEPGQLVYLEQPEIHLHPRAQEGLAQVIADAANRGVRVVLETHSELLLLAVQSLVAEGKLLPETVKLHWFTRREDGMTKIHSADLDNTGAFGDWPEDFSEVSLNLESRYIDAVAEAHFADN